MSRKTCASAPCSASDGDLDIIRHRRGGAWPRCRAHQSCAEYDIPYDTEATYTASVVLAAPGAVVSNPVRGTARAHIQAPSNAHPRYQPMELPSVETVNEQRVSKFKQQIIAALADPQLGCRQIIEQMERDRPRPSNCRCAGATAARRDAYCHPIRPHAASPAFSARIDPAR